MQCGGNIVPLSLLSRRARRLCRCADTVYVGEEAMGHCLQFFNVEKMGRFPNGAGK